MQARHHPGERARGPDPAVAHASLVGVGEPAGDGRTGQVDDHIDTLERPRVGPLGHPGPLQRMTGRAPHQADDSVPAGREVGAQGRADEARRARDGDRREAAVRWPETPVRGQVIGQLVMPVAEGLEEERARHRRLDAVGDPGPRAVDSVDGVERVCVAPLQGQ